MPSVYTQSNSSMVQQEAAAQAMSEQEREEKERASSVASSLGTYMRGEWEKARQAKQETNTKLLNNLLSFKSEYTSQKLAAIRQMGTSSELYIPLSNIKCRAGSAWVKDVVFQPGEIIFDLTPSPIPDLPLEVVQGIMETVHDDLKNHAMMVMQQAATMGQQIPPAVLQQQMKSWIEEAKERVKKEILAEAREAADRAKTKLHDQLTEGGFYQALDEMIQDIFIFKSAFIKGPIFRMHRTLDINTSPPSVVNKVMPFWERRSPFDVCPSGASSTINDGDLFDKLKLTKPSIFNLIGAPGYSDAAVREVLTRFDSKGYKEWSTVDTERAVAEEKALTEMSNPDTIDCLEYWGSVKGKMLLEWGLTTQQINDPDKFYDVCAWMIDTAIIKVVLNYDPLGRKPMSKASFLNVPGSFWGMSATDILEEIAQACNAIGRATVNNAAISSGPMVERNIDRLPKWEAKTIYPWKIFDATETQMNNAPAYRFYTPTMVADRLQTVLNGFMKTADEVSGIPAYSHGDVTVGGAGRTASGLNMLSENASRGIKDVIKNIDAVVEDVVDRLYTLDLVNGELKIEEIPDVKIVSKGSIALAEKGMKTIRQTEFLTATSNPTDLQIIGPDGRKYLLGEVAKSNGIDVDKLFAAIDKQMMMPQQQIGMAPGQAPPENPQSLDQAGNPINGQSIQQNPNESGR